MRSVKAILAVFLILASQLQAEVIQGSLSLIARQANTIGLPLGSIYGQAVDQTDGTYQYAVRACFDDSTWNCATGNKVDMTANWTCVSNLCSTSSSGNHWLLRINTVGTLGGGVNPADGSQHLLYVTQISRLGDTALNDIHVDWAWGLPVKWDATNSNLAPTYTAVTTTATPMTWASQAILVNSADTFSTGTNAGTLVCTVSGTPIYDNGSAGYYIQQHGTGGTPCANVLVSSMAVADTITVANFNTAWQAKLNSLGSSIQYINAAWMQPNIVVGSTGTGGCQSIGTQPCYGMAGWLTMYSTSNGVEPGGTYCTNKTFQLGQGSYLNTWFNTGTNSTPFNSYAIRPATLLAAAKCPSGCTTSNNYNISWAADITAWKAVVNAAKAAIGTNPTGIAQIPFISPGTHQELALAPSVMGTGINSHITTSFIGNSTTPTTAAVTSGTNSGNLLYYNDSAQWNYTTGFNFKPGSGFFVNASSLSGSVQTSAPFSGQTPVLSSMIADTSGGVRLGNSPAVMAAGTSVEPCESINSKDMYADLYLEYLAAGWTMGQAYWKSTQDPWNQNVWGDPMGQPYQPPIPGLGGTFTFGRRTFTGRGSIF